MEGKWSCYKVGQCRKGEWLCYRIGKFNGRENGNVTELDSLMEGEWSCYRAGEFNGGSMLMLQEWSV